MKNKIYWKIDKKDPTILRIQGNPTIDIGQAEGDCTEIHIIN